MPTFLGAQFLGWVVVILCQESSLLISRWSLLDRAGLVVTSLQVPRWIRIAKDFFHPHLVEIRNPRYVSLDAARLAVVVVACWIDNDPHSWVRQWVIGNVPESRNLPHGEQTRPERRDFNPPTAFSTQSQRLNLSPRSCFFLLDVI